MLRCSVTQLDLYATYKDSEDFPLPIFLAQLRGETPPSVPMQRGLAFHKAMEHVGQGESSVIKADGHAFAFTCDAEVEAWPRREVKAEKDYGGIIVRARCDRIYGLVIADDKSTESWGNGGAEKYLDKWQPWLYLDIFGCNRFDWLIWEVREIDLDENQPDVKHAWDVFNCHRLSQYRYPNMEADCEAFAREFRDFAERIGFTGSR